MSVAKIVDRLLEADLDWSPDGDPDDSLRPMKDVAFGPVTKKVCVAAQIGDVFYRHNGQKWEVSGKCFTYEKEGCPEMFSLPMKLSAHSNVSGFITEANAHRWSRQ